jgi:8-oxo-dGTP pyrophosphatase MutT (NUDIX family)/GNAT superfamily N-acetyltransferase/predicted nucleotidyltransferase
MWKSFDRTDALAELDEPTRIKLGSSDPAARAWIDRVYQLYPQTFQNNHVMPLGGSGDDQEFAMFELVPSLSRRGAVEVKWFQAYPLRQGVGSRAMQQLQQLAREDGISLTLFPWDKGQVSQSKLTKFYRGQGFSPTARGSKAMQWTPDQPGVSEGKQPGKLVVDAIQKVLPVAQEIWFHGSRATGKHRRNSDTDILVVVPDDLVGDQYLAVVRILQKLSSIFDNYDIQPTKAGNNIHRIAQEEGQLLWSNKPGVAEGLDEAAENKISFKVQKDKNKFATTLTFNGKTAGVYQYDATTGRSIAEVYPEFKGQGLGKLLVLHAIYTAAQLGLDFQEDESRTAEYDNVLDSLSSNGYIVDDDGYWYVTGTGEQYLNQSLKQGVAESAGIQPSAAGCVIVAADTGRWCLQQRSNTVSDPGVWSTWGGGRELGENLQQCVRRELAEESGYTGSVTLRLVDSSPSYATFMAHVPREFEPQINHECQDWRWSDPDDLPEPLHPGLQRTLMQLMENFADGKNPGRKGLSKRVGIPKKASLSQLQKIASSSTGERRRMAQWQLNMRRGKAKKNK